MSRISAKLSSKAQAVIPREIRERLKVGPGDTLVFDTSGDKVVIFKLEPEDNPFEAFTEWASPEDEEAYANL
jgi:antitoxin PrlF